MFIIVVAWSIFHQPASVHQYILHSQIISFTAIIYSFRCTGMSCNRCFSYHFSCIVFNWPVATFNVYCRFVEDGLGHHRAHLVNYSNIGKLIVPPAFIIYKTKKSTIPVNLPTLGSLFSTKKNRMFCLPLSGSCRVLERILFIHASWCVIAWFCCQPPAETVPYTMALQNRKTAYSFTENKDSYTQQVASLLSATCLMSLQ